jgi:bifunctional NMN adenylyltransferase/nudix hydrolase
MKTKVGIVIGRFQVPQLTPAHQELLERVGLENAHVVVLLGVSPNDGRSAENPLTYIQRLTLFRHYGLHTILPLEDRPTNAEWSANVDRLLDFTFPHDRYEVTLYGGRLSFREAYTGAYPVQDISCNNTSSGTEARQSIVESQVEGFLQGQIYAMQTQFPRVYPTVDTIVWRTLDSITPQIEVLLIKRGDNGEWGFIGGFVDPQDESYERAAKREVYEEVGLTAEAGLKCVGSVKVNDWRYRGTRDGIMTTLFTMQYAFGPVVPNPQEVADYQWVKWDDISKFLSKTHSPLWQVAADHILAQVSSQTPLTESV